MRPPRRVLGLWAVGAVALVGLMLGAYPRGADSTVLQAYQTLEAAPVPVDVVGWIEPTSAQARLLPNGYVLDVEAPGIGSVAISGNRDVAQASPGVMKWQDNGVAYWVQTSGDVELVRSRVTTLETARQQLTGPTALDTPVLYLFYLPAFLAFSGWAVGSLFWRP